MWVVWACCSPRTRLPIRVWLSGRYGHCKPPTLGQADFDEQRSVVLLLSCGPNAALGRVLQVLITMHDLLQPEGRQDTVLCVVLGTGVGIGHPQDMS